tara:strand:- start:75 stop:284 length:210 start_codon:yes stop_codon:yes gene_type:complete
MSAIIEKQILQWKEELKNHKERLIQARSVVETETKFISMLEGGIQFGENIMNEVKKEESDKLQTETIES